MGIKPEGVEGKLFRLLLEYLKDLSRSDRQIAKVLGASEATASRLKRRLVAEGLVYQFSVMPNFSKIGYEIMAFLVLNSSRKRYQKLRQEHKTGHEKIMKYYSLRGLKAWEWML